jgi:hypothetical protein
MPHHLTRTGLSPVAAGNEISLKMLDLSRFSLFFSGMAYGLHFALRKVVMRKKQE